MQLLRRGTSEEGRAERAMGLILDAELGTHMGQLGWLGPSLIHFPGEMWLALHTYQDHSIGSGRV
jgi:hypothetical protein